MAKGYWIARVDVADVEAYQQYVKANGAAYAKYGAICLARGGRTDVMEGEGRSRNVIWEFPSFQHAVDCFNSPEYQTARAFRLPVSEADIIIVEGLSNGPTPASIS